MQKNEGSKVVKWILIAVSVLFAFVFLILPLYTVISVALRNGVGKYSGNGFTRYSRFDIHIGIRQTKRALSLFTASRYKSSVCRTGNYIGNDICNVSVYIKRNYTDT